MGTCSDRISSSADAQILGERKMIRWKQMEGITCFMKCTVTDLKDPFLQGELDADGREAGEEATACYRPFCCSGTAPGDPCPFRSPFLEQLCVIGRLLRKPCSWAGSTRKSSASLNSLRAQNESACPCLEPVLRAPAVEEKRSCAPGDTPAPAWRRELCKEVQCSSHHQMVLLHAASQGHPVQGCFVSWKKTQNWGCFSTAWVSGE